MSRWCQLAKRRHFNKPKLSGDEIERIISVSCVRQLRIIRRNIICENSHDLLDLNEVIIIERASVVVKRWRETKAKQENILQEKTNILS